MTPGRYAADLLHQLGHEAPHLASRDTRPEWRLWADSGAQYLTGERDGTPLPSPAPLASAAQGAWLALAEVSERALDPDFPAYQLLGERAALLGLQRQGPVSAGGACRLLDCSDGQLALNLAREDDWRLLPAWLECPAGDWQTVAQTLRTRPRDAMVTRARLLGLAAAASGPPVSTREWFKTTPLAPPVKPRGKPLVVDLSSIWAGPLCTQLLGELGAQVIKVESTTRPDGARAGSPQFFDLLNGNKRSVALHLDDPTGRRQLHQLLGRADIIVESSRPRALQQMGIRAEDIVRAGKGTTWLSITGYGRDMPMGQWIAYGDDAGVAAGLSFLLGESGGTPVFCGDAIADPLTGLHAALLAWRAWTQGGGVLLDVSLCSVVARCITSKATPPAPALAMPDVSPPHARSTTVSAAVLGSDTAQILSELGINA